MKSIIIKRVVNDDSGMYGVVVYGNQPLNNIKGLVDVSSEMLADFKHEMTMMVIPKIVEKVEKRQLISLTRGMKNAFS